MQAGCLISGTSHHKPPLAQPVRHILALADNTRPVLACGNMQE
jgi:hypothetical protein